MVGAMGRMGERIVTLAREDPRFQTIAGVERPGSEFIGQFISKNHAPVVGDITEVLPKTDVVIDFSSATSVLKTASQVARAKRSLVIGTTGLKPIQIKKLKSLSRRIPIVFSPNMSVGVNLLFRLVQKAAETVGHYDIEIVEAHHSRKKDAPSGTAMKLADIAAEGSKRNARDYVFGRKGLVGERKKKELGILAVRAGDIVGDHTVLFSGGGERLELIHRAHSRDAFASGALAAAAWVYKKRPGFYSMFDVLKI